MRWRAILLLIALATPAWAQVVVYPPGLPFGSTQLDQAFGATRGSLLERGASGWTIITPSIAGLPFISGGAGADPNYAFMSGLAITGGTLPNAALVNMAANSVKGNATGSPAVQTDLSMTSLLGLFAITSAGNLYGAQGSFWTDITDADGTTNARIHAFRDRLFVDDGVLQSGAWNSGAGGLANSRSGTAINSVNWNWATREASLAAISSWGELAVVGQSVVSSANRSGDPHAATGASPIGVSGFGLNDRTTNPITAWGLYGECLRKVTAVGNCFGLELDTGDVGTPVDVDPFTSFGGGAGITVGIWNNCGGSAGGAVTYSNCSAAISMGNNGANFRRGLLFRSPGLDTTVGTSGGGVAIESSLNAEWRWMQAAGTPVFELYGTNKGLVLHNPQAGGSPHIGGTGTAPTISACGGTPGAPTGTDLAGSVIEGTTATGCTITFATAFNAQPICVANLNNGGTATAVTPNSVLVSSVQFNHASVSGAVLYWMCIGN